VALTFDDGHLTHYAQVFPLLAERGMRATFFVTTDWVGQRGYVTWGQLREMASAGMSVQSHTASHPFLSELSRADAVRELVMSKQRIEAELGQPCVTVALPGGDAPRGWGVSEYADLGFKWVATSRWGSNPAGPANAPALLARRYTVRQGTSDVRLPSLALARSTAADLEGLRLLALNALRTTLGASRYTRLRGRVLARGSGLASGDPVLGPSEHS